MRTLLRILALVPLVLPSVGPATSGAATIGGDFVRRRRRRWQATGAARRRTGSVSAPLLRRHRRLLRSERRLRGRPPTRAAGAVRSRVNTPGGGASPSTTVARTVYGRQDGADAGPPSSASHSGLTDFSARASQKPEGAGASISERRLIAPLRRPRIPHAGEHGVRGSKRRHAAAMSNGALRRTTPGAPQPREPELQRR